MTIETEDVVARLLAFEGSDALGNGDFTVCTKAADLIQSLSERIAVLEGDWQPIETAWRVGDQHIIVTDGAEVHGAAWWHSGEEAWLDCGGITPVHWKPLPEPPRASLIKEGTNG